MKRYKIIVHLSGDIQNLEDDMNKLSDDGYSFVSMYENNARIIVVMEKTPKAGRPKKTEE